MKRTGVAIICVMLLTIGVVMAGCGGKSESVSIFCFGDYIDPSLIDEFEEETGLNVVYSTFDTNEELYPVITKNAGDYDVICASDYMLERLISEDMLATLDYENIPNKKNLAEGYVEKVNVFDPGSKHTVPHTWGTLGILYNGKKYPKGTITSWKDLWKSEYSGKIVMPDSVRDTMAIALKKNGHSLNTLDVKQLKRAKADLIKQKPHVYKYANDAARDLVIGGSADMAVVWNGEYMYSKEENSDLEFVIPSEGTEEFIDGWAIPKAAKNKKAGEQWINFMLTKKSARKNFDYLTYTIPNKTVINDSKLGRNSIIFPGSEVLARCEGLKNLGYDGDELYNRYWKDFKSR